VSRPSGISLTKRLAVLAVVAFVATACATPVGVTRVSTQEVNRLLTASALSTGEPSEWSKQVLRRTNLFDEFRKDPAAALAKLRARLQQRTTADRLFALAELSFLYAERSGNRPQYLASAAYAYAYLFPEADAPPDPLDPRVRLSADLYNLALVRGLARPSEVPGDEPAADTIDLERGTLGLPFGEMTLAGNPSELLWAGYRFKRFIAVGELAVHGLRNRYRQAGIGAPLAAELEPVASETAEVERRWIPPRMKLPVTAFVRLEKPRRGVLSGTLRGRIELYPADVATTVSVNGRAVPLEMEPTAALAYWLEGVPVWNLEIAGFRFPEQLLFGDGLVMMHPYRRGQIPVVLVHGTVSSPARWAEMSNELSNDPVIRERYQVWLFTYNTGQPILYSARFLRRALQQAVETLDPTGEDPALRRMVIIGHSQGGLLARIVASHSGTRFWDAVSGVPLDQADFDPETRELFRETMFFEPLPSLERVIFLCAPHRGSFRAAGWRLEFVKRLVRFPHAVVQQFRDLAQKREFAYLHMGLLPTSVDNMSPIHRFIRSLNAAPIDPRIHTHSIIAVLGSGPLTGRTDGMVAYESAHLEGVESELVVQSGHSAQGNPEVIEEVRRILREHIGAR
jgi:pimeloyl-ACP methyl ester carboxylesterase